MAGQRLIGERFESTGDALGSLVAVQSQDYSGALWAMGQRVSGATEESLNDDFDSGKILRTHLMRPTWHFVAPDDIRWLLALTAANVKRRMATYDRQLGLDAAVFRRSEKLITRSLEGGQHLTRTELGKILGKAESGAPATQWLAHIMMNAELNGIVCSGPRRGKQFTYALLEERVPPVKAGPRDREESLRHLALRYFGTRGPATAQDFSWWSGLSMSDCQHAIGMVADKLKPDMSSKPTMWFVDEKPRGNIKIAHLLPNYDEYFIGYKNRSAIGHRIRDLALVSGGNALISHVVAINGALVGGWKRSRNTRGVKVQLQLVVRLSAAERKLIASAVQRFSDFLGVPATIS